MKTPILRFDVPLRGYTTFGIGGPATLFADVGSSEQLLEALLWARRQRLPHLVLGNGSNILVGDNGYDGLVIRNARCDRVEPLAGNQIRAASGVTVARLIALTIPQGLSGLEHFAGIPGTLGGALWQNLHFLDPDRRRLCFLGDLLEAATVFADGSVERVGRDWFRFGYDSSRLHDGDAVVLDATLRLTAAEAARLNAVVHANLAWRRRRHPPHAAERSAGCVFRNPAGASAAHAIDAAGLKGLRIGGAAVSTRHANFIVNLGGATAAHVRALIEVVAEQVERRCGLRLEPELAFVGEQSPVEAALG